VVPYLLEKNWRHLQAHTILEYARGLQIIDCCSHCDVDARQATWECQTIALFMRNSAQEFGGVENGQVSSEPEDGRRTYGRVLSRCDMARMMDTCK